MSSVVAIGASSASIAISAEAKRKACEGVLNSFDAKGANVEAMRVYSDCVQLIHPEDLSDGNIIAIKVVLVLCFIGGAVGGFLSESYLGGEIVDRIMGFLSGFLLTFAAICIMFLLVMALCFIFFG